MKLILRTITPVHNAQPLSGVIIAGAESEAVPTILQTHLKAFQNYGGFQLFS